MLRALIKKIFYTLFCIVIVPCYIYGAVQYKWIIADISPYKSFEEATRHTKISNWDVGETNLDAATIAYGVSELITHINRVNNQRVNYNSGQSSGLARNIELVLDPKLDLFKNTNNFINAQSFVISIERNGSVRILAINRIGLLYGVYEFLRQSGFEWYDYQTDYTPLTLSKIKSSENMKVFKPQIKYRGFWIPHRPNLDSSFIIWMCRNKFNVVGVANDPILTFLGIKQWGGGHQLLQKVFSEPDLFKNHPDWYSLVKGERHQIPSKGVYTNPNFSSKGMAEYFLGQLIREVQSGDLVGVDILNIWPSDRRFWRAYDQSEESKQIGNYTDNLVFFYKFILNGLRTAYEEGIIKKEITLAGIAYQTSWPAPTNIDLFESLLSENFIQVMYPSTRTWSGIFNDSLSFNSANSKINDHLMEWGNVKGSYGLVEYFNKIAFSVTGQIDSKSFAQNFTYLTKSRDQLYAYMHPVRNNEGPYKLLNHYISIASWFDTNSTAEQLGDYLDQSKHEYFNKLYESCSREMERIYDYYFRSTENTAEMFGHNSLEYSITQHVKWAVPHYKKEEIMQFIVGYLDGGICNVPDDTGKKEELTETFIGLKKSIDLQLSAINDASIIQEGLISSNSQIGELIQCDIGWFMATNLRYQLLLESTKLFVLREQGVDVKDLENDIADRIGVLKQLSLTNNTWAGVDQRSFLILYERLLKDVQ